MKSDPVVKLLVPADLLLCTAGRYRNYYARAIQDVRRPLLGKRFDIIANTNKEQ